MRRIAVALALLLAGCKPAEDAVALRFEPVVDGTPITCTSAIAGKTLSDLRFFVHDVALLASDGRAVPVVLDTAPPWQSSQVALIDLEDGQGTCDTGSPMLHGALTGHVAHGIYTGLRFTVGVPFALNHGDPVEAPPPLDQTAMHWHWQAGYKFMRAGIQEGERITWLHLGSTGCRGHIGAVTGCAAANRPVVTIPRFDPGLDTVAIDVGVLFSERASDGAQSCQSEPDNAVCKSMLRHVGLADKPQDVFHALGR